MWYSEKRSKTIKSMMFCFIQKKNSSCFHIVVEWDYSISKLKLLNRNTKLIREVPWFLNQWISSRKMLWCPQTTVRSTSGMKSTISFLHWTLNTLCTTLWLISHSKLSTRSKKFKKVPKIIFHVFWIEKLLTNGMQLRINKLSLFWWVLVSVEISHSQWNFKILFLLINFLIYL